MIVDLLTFPVWGLFDLENEKIIEINGEPAVSDDRTFMETLYALLETQVTHKDRYILRYGERFATEDHGLSPVAWDMDGTSEE